MGKSRTIHAVLAADIGTTSLKAALIDMAAGGKRLLDFSRETYKAGGGAAEGAGAAELWEAAFYHAVRVLRERMPGVHIEAVCVSGNGPTLVPVTGNPHSGVSLPPLHWFSPVLPAASGAEAAVSFFLPRAAYFKENDPENYAKTDLFLSCPEWLSVRLGAEAVTALPTPHYRPYYYDESQFAAFSLDSRKFPPFVPLGVITGHVSVEAARRSGLPAGLPVVAGGPDFIMALLGSAAIEPGLVCDRAGSSEGINVCVRKPPSTADAAAHSLRVLPHAIAGLWNVSVVLPESGILFDRYRLETGRQNIPYEETLKEMVVTESGEARFHPTLQKIADSVKAALETLRVAGYPVREMRHSGGQAKSPLWNRLKANICGCTLLVPEIVDTELAGNTAAAMFALGEEPSIAAACQKIAVITERIEAPHSRE
ncbi:MAG: FGGY-family carbohydrate kinase [Spirochaetaceae bacterium]|jgi:sugar (pentulose or hexulose) kinase|nr:FGGY-family carbohydrate kinase [Spirochaetaceae bacterium]